MDLNFDLYMNGVVEQARNEIEEAGYEQLTTADEVDSVLKQDGTSLVMVNSVCGCWWYCTSSSLSRITL